MAVGTRYNQVRMEQKFSRAVKQASGGEVKGQYEAAAKEVAHETSARIKASGRGGDHNSEFANIETKVFESRAGRYNINLGWLNPPASAHEAGGGGRLWYQYQDAGFHLFGGPNWIEGVGATIDQRFNLLAAIHEINIRRVHQIARTLRGR